MVGVGVAVNVSVTGIVLGELDAPFALTVTTPL
jgi:hypothetical protein